MTKDTGAERKLKGRRALVTGGGAGLGYIFSDALAEAGADLVICGRRADVIKDSAGKLATAHGIKAEGHAVDISTEDGIDRLKSVVGEVDILVNNAGYSIRRNSWLDVTRAEWEEVLTLHLTAPFFLAQRFAPGMMERGFGRIVNLSSIYGVVGCDPNHYPDSASDNTSYTTSKHGIVGMTKNLALRVSHAGVTVNAISPGIFPTGTVRADGNKGGVKAAQILLAKTIVGRFGTPPDLRGLIKFIASDDSSFITGHNFVVDGGFTIT